MPKRINLTLTLILCCVLLTARLAFRPSDSSILFSTMSLALGLLFWVSVCVTLLFKPPPSPSSLFFLLAADLMAGVAFFFGCAALLGFLLSVEVLTPSANGGISVGVGEFATFGNCVFAFFLTKLPFGYDPKNFKRNNFLKNFVPWGANTPSREASPDPLVRH